MVEWFQMKPEVIAYLRSQYSLEAPRVLSISEEAVVFVATC